MTKIRLLVSIAGPLFSYAAGETVEIDAAEARRWIAAGIAEAVTDAPAPEAAVSPPRETTTRKRAKPRGGA